MELFPEYRVPAADEIVVHLRLGDGLCAQYDPQCRGNDTSPPNCWENDADCWIDGGGELQYTYSKLWYMDLYSVLPPRQHVIIVSDTEHWTRCADPRRGDRTHDNAYKRSVVHFFKKLGNPVTLRETTTPDEDFIFMCGASTFIASGGGFSELVSAVVRIRGGNVLNPAKTQPRFTPPEKTVSQG